MRMHIINGMYIVNVCMPGHSGRKVGMISSEHITELVRETYKHYEENCSRKGEPALAYSKFAGKMIEGLLYGSAFVRMSDGTQYEPVTLLRGEDFYIAKGEEEF